MWKKDYLLEERSHHSLKNNILNILPVGIYFFKVNKEKNWAVCETGLKITTIKTPERLQWHHSGVFIVIFKRISNLSPMYMLLTLSKSITTRLLLRQHLFLIFFFFFFFFFCCCCWNQWIFDNLFKICYIKTNKIQ